MCAAAAEIYIPYECHVKEQMSYMRHITGLGGICLEQLYIDLQCAPNKLIYPHTFHP